MLTIANTVLAASTPNHDCIAKSAEYAIPRAWAMRDILGDSVMLAPSFYEGDHECIVV